jgi:hypothetical protein
MSRLRLPLLHLAASVMVALPVSGNAAEASKLVSVTPFVSQGSAAAPAASHEAYEFAAVSIIGKKTLVNIYEKAAKKGRWIAEGDTVEGIAVVKFDPATDQVVARIHGVEKTLSLRKASVAPANARVGTTAAGGSAQPWPPPATWTAATNGGNVQPATLVPTTAAMPLPPQPPPPAKGTVAYQEQEARMLVSDLLEIGMAQRKAYEEAQKKAAVQPGQEPAKNP